MTTRKFSTLRPPTFGRTARRIFKHLVFGGVLAGAMAFWPVGCAGPLLSKSDAPSEASSPDSVVKPSSVPKSFLPHPAFAYAKTGDDAVSIADIAERASPSVVNVSTSRAAKTSPLGMPFLDDPMFRHFFGPQGPQQGPGPEQRGLGSGVVVSRDGIVLTNNHVIAEADKIIVTTADDREFQADVIGADKKSDLAVLKLKGDASSLKPIEFGDSARLRLGDVVLAIGNPFAVGQTITMGIVSAKGRANMGIVDYEDFIQTDAAINPGNSGGALVDMEGRLVGINTAILSRTGGNMGIGFAIPSNMAKPIMDSLLKHGKVVRGWLGVSIQDIDRDLASAMNLPSTTGALIAEVMQGSPAAKAGLQAGDVVLEMDGSKVSNAGKLRNSIAAAGSKSTVKLKVRREGKERTVDVQLGELPGEEQARAGRSGTAPGGGALDGLTVESLTPQNRRAHGISESVKTGVVVVDIDRRSPAAASGLRPGDVIVEVNRRPIADVGAFKQAYSGSKRQTLLLVNRRGQSLFLVLKR